MPYDINQSLERMERNLQDIDSAKKQVENTIASNKELTKSFLQNLDELKAVIVEIESCRQKLQKLQEFLEEDQHTQSTQLKETLEQIKKRFEDIISLFQKQSKETTENFENKCNTIVANFKDISIDLKLKTEDILKVKNELIKTTEEMQPIIKNELNNFNNEIIKNNKQIEEKLQQVQSNIKTNRILMITGITLISALLLCQFNVITI
ncbi:hypothetical protein [Succinatimonas hippei]|uniref:hypothetical protein n=1 Tax=Succinatimonas hippei TaxID=626938 RepID=UPI00248F8B49|nr:hypothetical protein [Succinatimonas hippei]